MASDLRPKLSSSTSVFGLKKKSRRAKGSVPPSQTPKTSREIKEIKVNHASVINEKYGDGDLEKVLMQLEKGNSSRSGSFNKAEKDGIVASQLEWGQRVLFLLTGLLLIP
ncbi:hypothetical protein SAY87_031009 [Trapa incisa]|uniref:Uncharacterized protein n=1 Tax=Trapa incisa TaxID=236973 RepID=A0AAN7QKB5_9MYRT|nr:hypothetical protein SAY87_031009 [Trapa incisa]